MGCYVRQDFSPASLERQTRLNNPSLIYIHATDGASSSRQALRFICRSKGNVWDSSPRQQWVLAPWFKKFLRVTSFAIYSLEFTELSPYRYWYYSSYIVYTYFFNSALWNHLPTYTKSSDHEPFTSTLILRLAASNIKLTITSKSHLYQE